MARQNTLPADPPKAAQPKRTDFVQPAEIRSYKGVLLHGRSDIDFYFPDGGGLMAAETFSLAALQTRGFLNLQNQGNGYQQPDQPEGRSGDPTKFASDTTLPGQPVYGKIILGHPESATENNEWTDAQGRSGSYVTVELDCAICSIGFNPQVIQTFIQGLEDSIKEFISGGTKDITITGIYNSTPGVAPITFIQNLSNIFNAPVPIPVTNYFLNNNNIYYIVIMPGTELPQEQGGYAYQKFTIRAVSDTPSDKMLP